MSRTPGTFIYTAKPIQVPMSKADWDQLNLIISMTGYSIAQIVRYAVRCMSKSKHFRAIKKDQNQMYSGLPKPGRQSKKNRKQQKQLRVQSPYDQKRLQIPATEDDVKLLETMSSQSGIPKAALVREAIHWYVDSNREKFKQARRLLNIPDDIGNNVAAS